MAGHACRLEKKTISSTSPTAIASKTCYQNLVIFDTKSKHKMALLSFTEDTEPSRIDENLKWNDQQPPSLPEVPKPAKVTQSKKGDGVTSLSFEQVNDNADELIELRGEGRYFGVTDPDTGDSINALQSLGPLCDNCHRRGHIRSKCKTVVCHKCGVVGDHYETQCPTTMVCSRCGEKGHISGNCKSKTRKRQYCKHCDTFKHGDENCPSIWRSYVTIAKKDNFVIPVMSCYNCGDDNHFGDECPQQRTSRIPNINGSAFSGTNLPKNLRNKYFDILYGKRSKKPSNEISFDQYRRQNASSSSNSSNAYRKQNYNDYPRNDNSSGSKKRNFESSRNFVASGVQPSRSGFIASNTSNKKPKLPLRPAANRSGYIPQKDNRRVNPNRSGVVQRGKKARGDFQALY